MNSAPATPAAPSAPPGDQLVGAATVSRATAAAAAPRTADQAGGRCREYRELLGGVTVASPPRRRSWNSSTGDSSGELLVPLWSGIGDLVRVHPALAGRAAPS